MNQLAVHASVVSASRLFKFLVQVVGDVFKRDRCHQQASILLKWFHNGFIMVSLAIDSQQPIRVIL
jgi:hypothetical protein